MEDRETVPAIPVPCKTVLELTSWRPEDLEILDSGMFHPVSCGFSELVDPYFKHLYKIRAPESTADGRESR